MLARTHKKMYDFTYFPMVNNMSKYLILVPARFGSTRFPGKPLALINNRPMIDYVVENCKDTGFDYCVVTDNQEIEDHINSTGGKVVRVDDDVQTGSERIALAYQRFFKASSQYEFIINVQGDEPLLRGELIRAVGSAHAKSDFDIFTALKERKSSEDDFKNPNIVKCVKVKETGKCLYFSRSPIPFNRDSSTSNWFQHIGLYSYKVESLEKFVSLSVGEFEEVEKLEQLRALENNMSIGALEIEVEILGVDAPSDIPKIEKALL